MRKGLVYFNEELAGELIENEEGYIFQYNIDYVKREGVSVSLTLPLQEVPFVSKTMFPFFDGLVPEGWLLDIVHEYWKLDPRDRMGLILACCKDTIGAVSVIDAEEAQNG